MDWVPDFSDQDKRGHLAAGSVAGCYTALVCHATLPTDTPRWVGPTLVLLSGVALGIAKEEYDRRNGGTVETADVVATSMGAVVPALTFSWTF